MAAAAWAQSGYSRPIACQRMLGDIAISWPALAGGIELPSPSTGMPTAAFAKVEAAAAQPMRIRLNMPSMARPAARLAMPETALSELAAEPEELPRFIPAQPAAPRKPSLVEKWFSPAAPRTAKRSRDRDELFNYNEPAPQVKSSSSDAWRAMFSGWMPSAGVASGVFAVLFLFSAVGIFFSAPSGLSQRSPSWRLGNLQTALRARAVMRMDDDFRSGLNRWFGPAGWAQDWSYDQAGFLRPGKLGFLQQSMNLTNYRMEFMGQIERKSLGWAFRAKDTRNYYVAKLTIAKPGPLPMVDLIRYAVMDGKEGAKTRVGLPFSVRNDTLYQVEMNVRGNEFRASVNGHVVDAWTDNRLRAGGVGFVTGLNEAARVRWIRVSDKDDLLGRVCSYLTARAYHPDSENLSASYYTFFASPASPANF
jgi:hypothetical protein